MRTALFITISHLFFSCSIVKEEFITIYGSSFDLILNQYNAKGTILIYDQQKKIFNSNSFHKANTGYLPGSTYLIPQTIIALETNKINSDKNQYISLQSAFQQSYDPYFQDIIREIGLSKMNQYFIKYNYPKMHINEYTLDNFWFYGSSKITPFQQITFLEKLCNNKISIKKETYNKILELMLITETNEYKLYGKESWTNYNNNGWFIGFIVKNDKKYYFATNLEPIRPQSSKDLSITCKETTLEALQKMNII